VKTGQFSRGKEITKQWYCYETIALFTVFDKRLGKGRCQAKFLTSRHVLMHRVIFYISNRPRKLID